MNLLDYPYFQFRGRKSNEFSMRIRNEMSFVVPQAALELQSVDGRSSSIIYDRNRFEDFEKVFPVRIYKERDRTIAAQLRDIAGWLYLERGYSPLEFSEYPEYFYKALGYSGASAKDERRDRLDIDFSFKCQPFVFRKDGEDERDVKSGEGITNPENFSSFPLISFNKTTASVDSNIYINYRQFRIAKEAGTGIITIDSENGIAYKAGGVNVSKQCFMANGKYDPIVLEPGRNEISYTNLNQFKIKPRWRNLAV
ncbi:phage tail protein [Enterococcus termitis]